MTPEESASTAAHLYAVKAETHDGKVVALRKGFGSKAEAESHPVRMSLWKRVWIEAYTGSIEPKAFPPKPWAVEWSARSGPNGVSFVYVVDANGRKVINVWGPPQHRVAIAELIVAAANEAESAARDTTVSSAGAT